MMNMRTSNYYRCMHTSLETIELFISETGTMNFTSIAIAYSFTAACVASTSLQG